MEGFLFRCLLHVPHEQRWAALGGPSVSSLAGAVLGGRCGGHWYTITAAYCVQCKLVFLYQGAHGALFY